MASRVVVPQVQAKGEAVVAGENKMQKKNAPADGRNRRALGDIGNLVPARPNDAKPNRPITRSFRAQLIANAEAAKAAANNKKQACINVNGSLAVPEVVPKRDQAVPNPEVVLKRDQAVPNPEVVLKRDQAVPNPEVVPKRDQAVPKPIQKRANPVKPKPPQKEFIEISSDSDEDAKKQEINKSVVSKKKDGEGASRKKAPTLTAVLTARSKMACGITNKPKEQAIDIDAADVNNELAAVEYIEDMYSFYKLVENESRPHDYIDSQPEINEQMRAILVDWLVEVHSKFALAPETFYLTINIIDRFLAVKTVARRELQLVGISAMLMASKYEEIWAPEVNDFVCLSDRAYSHEQILKMEKIILGKLEWTLTVPTPYVFLVRFIKASLPKNDERVENLVYYLAELGMMHYATIMYCPSMIAASSVYAARSTLNKSPVWNDTLKLHTGFSEPQLIDCAKLLATLQSTALKSKLRSVYRKYASSERGSVALLPAAKALLPDVDARSI